MTNDTTQTHPLITKARRLAERNRVEGWNGNDCDEAMRVLNALAELAEHLENEVRRAEASRG